MNIVTRLLTGAVIGASVYAYASGAPNYGLSDDLLDTLVGYSAPTQCADFTPRTLNRVIKNAPLAKLVDMKVLEVTATRDTGSTKVGLKCEVEVFASSGGNMTLYASTKTIHGNPYILVSLF